MCAVEKGERNVGVRQIRSEMGAADLRMHGMLWHAVLEYHFGGKEVR